MVTHQFRYIKKFHEGLVDWLLNTNMRTLRRAAVELDKYCEDNQQYIDAQYLPHLLRTLEKVIQTIGKTKWSVKKMKSDLRGRSVTHKKSIPIDKRIKRVMRKNIELFDDE